MKASEVLDCYNAGRRDFRNIDLRGQKLQRVDLSGSDFSHSDIRGATFAKANLKNVRFDNVKASLTKRSSFFSLALASFFALSTARSFLDYSVYPLASTFIRDASSENAQFLGLVLLITYVYLMFFMTFPARALVFSGNPYILGRTLNYKAHPGWLALAFIFVAVGSGVSAYAGDASLFPSVILLTYIYVTYSAFFLVTAVSVLNTLGYFLSIAAVILGAFLLFSEVDFSVGFTAIIIAVLMYSFSSALGFFMGSLMLADNRLYRQLAR